MIPRALVCLLAVVSLPWSSPTLALDWYAAVAVGTDYGEDVELEESGLRAALDRGYPAGGGALGVRLADRLYAEVEGLYRVNDFEVLYARDGSVEINPEPESKTSSTSVMANLWYEFLPASGMRPFLGAGLGWARVRYEAANEVTGEMLIDDRADTLAYQLLAGFTFDVSPRLALTAGYRYWKTDSFDLKTVSGERESSRQTVHATLLGLRYHFRPRDWGSAAAAPPGEHRGFYLAARGGAGFAKDAEIKDNIANFDAFGPGPFTAVAAGWSLPGPWRVELEASTRRNDAELIDFNPEFGEGRADGDIRMRSLMANAYYDFRGSRGFRPHVGLGVGAVRGVYDVQVRGATFVDDRDTGVAFQLLVGATTQLTERLGLSVGYRYWLSLPLEMEQPDGRPLETEQVLHTVHAGLRYTLR